MDQRSEGNLIQVHSTRGEIREEGFTVLSIVADRTNVQESGAGDIIELQAIPKDTRFCSLALAGREQGTYQSMTVRVILSHIEGN